MWRRGLGRRLSTFVDVFKQTKTPQGAGFEEPDWAQSFGCQPLVDPIIGETSVLVKEFKVTSSRRRMDGAGLVRSMDRQPLDQGFDSPRLHHRRRP